MNNTHDLSTVVTVEAVTAWAIKRGTIKEAPPAKDMAAALMKAGATRVTFVQDGKVCVGYRLPPIAEARRAFAENLELGGIDWPEAECWRVVG